MEKVGSQADQGKIWANTSSTLKNPVHQVINNKIDSFIYCMPLFIFWECPVISSFCIQVSKYLTHILDLTVEANPCFVLLNDHSTVPLQLYQRKLPFSGLTSAKKVIVCSWFPPKCLPKYLWLYYLIDIAHLNDPLQSKNNNLNLQSDM